MLGNLPLTAGLFAQLHEVVAQKLGDAPAEAGGPAAVEDDVSGECPELHAQREGMQSRSVSQSVLLALLRHGDAPDLGGVALDGLLVQLEDFEVELELVRHDLVDAEAPRDLFPPQVARGGVGVCRVGQHQHAAGGLGGLEKV